MDLRRNTAACLLSLMGCFAASGQWTPVPVAPGHDLHAIGNGTGYLLVAGVGGIHRSLDDGDTWAPLAPAPAFQAVYDRTVFRGIAARTTNALVVGEDTVEHRAVVFRYGHSPLVLDLVYHGAVGTALNAVVADVNSSDWLAVGDDGLVLHLEVLAGAWTGWELVAPFTGQDLRCGTTAQFVVFIGGDSCLYRSSSLLGARTVDLAEPVLDVAAVNSALVLAVSPGRVYRKSMSTWAQQMQVTTPFLPRCVAITPAPYHGYFGTTDGVRRTQGTASVIEWQPSSAGSVVNDILSAGNGVLYAACADGSVLRTGNGGGPVQPYVLFTGPNGGCVGSLLQFTNWGGQLPDWAWTVNGANAGTGQNLAWSFNTVGTYTVTLTGTDGPHTGSMSTTFHIVEPPPFTSVQYSVSDTVLCHQGESTVTIPQSDADYRYRLYTADDEELLDEVPGTGGAIQLHSGVRTDSCRLVIAVTSLLADCERWMEPSIPLHVEHTLARPIPGFLNAESGEAVAFFNRSEQAATYQWSFTNGAAPATSSLARPVAAFSAPGASQATLIATSASGCTDTVVTEGPFIYDPAQLSEGCWAFRAGTWTSTDPYPDGLNGYTGLELDPATRRVYAAAGTDRSRIESRMGRSFDAPVPDEGGDLIARYDAHGMLKWCVYGGTPWRPGNHAETYSPNVALSLVTEDIFAYNIPHLYDDTVRFADGEDFVAPFNLQRKLMRIDPLGRKVWMALSDLRAWNIKADQQDAIYVLARGCGLTEVEPARYRSPSGVLTEIPSCDKASVLVKVDAQGELLWWAFSDGAVPNNNDAMTGLAVDGVGNVYVAGNHQNGLSFFSADGDELPIQGFGNDAMYGLLVKYGPSGELLWGHRFDHADAFHVAVDAEDNTYVTLRMWEDSTTFPSHGGPALVVEGRHAVLCSYSPEGTLRWVAAASSPVDGHDVTCTADGEVIASGYSPRLRIIDGNGVALDSVWSEGSVTLLGRWSSTGDLRQLTTLEGDSALSLFRVDGHTRLAADPAGGVLVASSFRTLPASNAVIAGDTIVGQDHQFMTLAHVDSVLCDVGPDIILTTHRPAERPALRAFPVPATDVVHVWTGSAAGAAYVVRDATGRAVVQGRADASPLRIDVQGLRPGIYWVEVAGGAVQGAVPFLK